MVLAPFLITFREGLEAALIIAIIIAYLIKVNRHDAKRYVWLGTGLALILSLVIGFVIILTFGALEGFAEKVFEGIAGLFATAVLTTMIFWMTKNARSIKAHLHKKIDVMLNKKYLLGIGLLAFIAVFREGIETVLFLTATYTADATGTLIGTVLGLLVTVFFAFLLLKGTVRLPLQKFFKYTSVILIVFAAGLFGYGIHELLEAAEIAGYETGFLAEHAYDINPADQTNLLHEKGAIGSIFKALVGWDGNPEWLRVFGYIGYWLVIGAYVLVSFRKPTLEILKPELKQEPATKPL